jgi:hypothetical protein
MRTTDWPWQGGRRLARQRTTTATTRSIALAAAVLVASATAVYAIDLTPDGVHLESEWTTGGHAWLELEDRNLEPTICFIWENDAPQDGDGIASRILTRDGTEVLDLGVADQWMEGHASGCEIPTTEAYRDVFAHPENYIVEFHVVEEQGTPPTPPVRSLPLQRDSDGDTDAESENEGYTDSDTESDDDTEEDTESG